MCEDARGLGGVRRGSERFGAVGRGCSESGEDSGAGVYPLTRRSAISFEGVGAPRAWPLLPICGCNIHLLSSPVFESVIALRLSPAGARPSETEAKRHPFHSRERCMGRGNRRLLPHARRDTGSAWKENEASNGRCSTASAKVRQDAIISNVRYCTLLVQPPIRQSILIRMAATMHLQSLKSVASFVACPYSRSLTTVVPNNKLTFLCTNKITLQQ